MIEVPETLYARTSDGVHLAYQVVGDGRPEIIFTAGGQFPIDLVWDEPRARRFFERLSSFGRFALYDGRGWGASSADAGGGAPTVERWADDLGLVMDAAGFDRPVLVGVGPGAFFSTFFAATRPDRVHSLVLMEGFARYLRDPDYPAGLPSRLFESTADTYFADYGTGASVELYGPSAVDDMRFRRWWARCERLSSDPTMGRRYWRELADRDLRAVLPTLRVPTLVLHRRGDRFIRVDHGRYLAAHIPGAVYREVDGEDHIFFLGDTTTVLDQIELFLTGKRSDRAASDRMLATVLFTDIVGSTERAADLGDRRWADLLDAHDRIVATHLDDFRGRRVNPTGDGVLAAFDGPARAIHRAVAIRDSVHDLGIRIRAGLHSGEVEQREADLGGIAVHIGARVQQKANADEILVSRTVVDLVAGSGIAFDDRGEHELRGVPGTWKLFAVAG